MSAPKPYYRCTIVVNMPPDNGRNIRPDEVVEALQNLGVEFVEWWHGEDMIQRDEETE